MNQLLTDEWLGKTASTCGSGAVRAERQSSTSDSGVREMKMNLLSTSDASLRCLKPSCRKLASPPPVACRWTCRTSASTRRLRSTAVAGSSTPRSCSRCDDMKRDETAGVRPPPRSSCSGASGGAAKWASGTKDHSSSCACASPRGVLRSSYRHTHSRSHARIASWCCGSRYAATAPDKLAFDTSTARLSIAHRTTGGSAPSAAPSAAPSGAHSAIDASISVASSSRAAARAADSPRTRSIARGVRHTGGSRQTTLEPGKRFM
mmetsp:Transcript_33828/g.107979  ORF Transcript_33828/g.107979 Transcript_33828/m.107979 type:complete len:263 (-) Transcript_33828:278-1066(-)